MSRWRKWALGVTAAAVLLVTGGAIAYASIPDANGVIHGCYKNTDGSLRVINTDIGQTCPNGFTALNWDQHGVSGYQLVFRSQDIPAGYAGEFFNTYASCPSNLPIPLGGGVDAPGPGATGVGQSWVTDKSFPGLPAPGSGPGTWTVQLTLVGAAGPTVQVATVTTWVECVKDVRTSIP